MFYEVRAMLAGSYDKQHGRRAARAFLRTDAAGAGERPSPAVAHFCVSCTQWQCVHRHMVAANTQPRILLSASRRSD